jgi:hypothetical protein
VLGIRIFMARRAADWPRQPFTTTIQHADVKRRSAP